MVIRSSTPEPTGRKGKGRARPRTEPTPGAPADTAPRRRQRRDSPDAANTAAPASGEDTASDLVWHTTVVAAALTRLHGSVFTVNLSPPGADVDTWDAEVHSLVMEVARHSPGGGSQATAILRLLLGELRALAQPMPYNRRASRLQGNNLLIARAQDIRQHLGSLAS